jgi:hypothetical protein
MKTIMSKQISTEQTDDERSPADPDVTAVYAGGHSGTSSTAFVEKPPKPDHEVEVEIADYDSLYEKVVRPNRAIYLHGYFRRWLKYLGPSLAWLYVAFRQAAYTLGSRTGRAINRIPGEKIASLAGVTERTYWNRVEKSETWEKLKGLVQISDHGPQWDNAAATPKRLPRRYTIAMTLPLTPADSHSLTRWISENIERFGGPEGVLRAAADAPLDELIPLDATEESDPLTVTQLVRQLYEGGKLSNAQLDALASAIQNRIMPPGDLIVVTEFFLKNILSHLGDGPGWMLTLLRDLCYVDHERGESRNRVIIQGGYAEIAGWLGMSRPRTVWDWLNEKFPPKHKEAGKYKKPIIRVYMNEIAKDETQLDFAGQPRVFDVLLEEIPREFLEIAATNPNDAIFSIAMTRFSESVDAVFSIGMTRFSQPNDAIFSIAMTRFSESVDAIFRVLISSLTLKTNSLNTDQPTPAVDANDAHPDAPLASETNGERGRDAEQTDSQNAVDQSVWNFSQLAQTSDIHPSKVAAMNATVPDEQERALRFVGWILHAHSPKGKTLKDETGVGMAIANNGKKPGNAFLRLARLGPEKLRALFDSDFARTLAEGTAEEMIYRANLKKLPLHRKQDLYYRLFAEDAPEPTTASPPPVFITVNADADETPKPVPFKVPRRQIKIVE